jgi:hypothetical protein
MAQPELLVERVLLRLCLNWFQEDFRQGIVSLIESQFPNNTRVVRSGKQVSS